MASGPRSGAGFESSPHECSGDLSPADHPPAPSHHSKPTRRATIVAAILTAIWLGGGCGAFSTPRFVRLGCERTAEIAHAVAGEDFQMAREQCAQLVSIGLFGRFLGAISTSGPAYAAYLSGVGYASMGPRVYVAARIQDACMLLPVGALDCACRFGDPVYAEGLGHFTPGCASFHTDDSGGGPPTEEPTQPALRPGSRTEPRSDHADASASRQDRPQDLDEDFRSLDSLISAGALEAARARLNILKTTKADSWLGVAEERLTSLEAAAAAKLRADQVSEERRKSEERARAAADAKLNEAIQRCVANCSAGYLGCVRERGEAACDSERAARNICKDLRCNSSKVMDERSFN